MLLSTVWSRRGSGFRLEVSGQGELASTRGGLVHPESSALAPVFLVWCPIPSSCGRSGSFTEHLLKVTAFSRYFHKHYLNQAVHAFWKKGFIAPILHMRKQGKNVWIREFSKSAHYIVKWGSQMGAVVSWKHASFSSVCGFLRLHSW